MMKKILCMLLAVVMAFGLVACANSGNNGGASNNGGEGVEGGSENKEPVTITLYPTNANVTSGKVGGWLGDYLLSKGFILAVKAPDMREVFCLLPWTVSDWQKSSPERATKIIDVVYVLKYNITE